MTEELLAAAKVKVGVLPTGLEIGAMVVFSDTDRSADFAVVSAMGWLPKLATGFTTIRLRSWLTPSITVTLLLLPVAM